MKTFPELSIDSKILIEELKKVEKGKFISYEDLGTAINKPIKDAWGSLTTARRRMMNDYNKIFEVVRGKGLICLEDEENVKINSEFYISRINRVAAIGRKKITSVKFDDLSKESKIKHNAALAQLGVVTYISKPQKTKQLEAKINEHDIKFSVGNILEYLKLDSDLD